MSNYWSPSRKGFFRQDVHGDAMPSDCVRMEDADYQALMSAQNQGMEIVSDNGVPSISDPMDGIMEHAEIMKRFEAMVSAVVENLAKSWGYDSVLSAATYAASAQAYFKAEAVLLLDYRDAMWIWAASIPVPSPVTRREFAATSAALLAKAPAGPAKPPLPAVAGATAAALAAASAASVAASAAMGVG